MLENILTLLMLILLQAVLGLDNLLYISLESQKAPKEKQDFARKAGIGIAIVLRIVLLFVLVSAKEYFEEPEVVFNFEGIASAEFSIHHLITLAGGGFIIYTATKEIVHMLNLKEGKVDEMKPSSINGVVISIAIMNIVFSFDSILSAMALTEVFWVMAVAIVSSGLLMMWLSGSVSNFLKKNKIYEVLGLFVLFVVGIMLVTEGGHEGHLYLFGNEITPMSKTTFYFVITVLILTDVVQSVYQRNLKKAQEPKEG